jgi:hypothetical protein
VTEEHLIEFESKFEVTDHALTSLRAVCKSLATRRQFNVYYDDREWTLAQARATLRVRFETGITPCLTLKQVSSQEETWARISTELTVPLTDVVRNNTPHGNIIVELPTSFTAELQRLGAKDVVRMGGCLCRREVLALPGDVGSIEVDHVTLPGNKALVEIEIDERDRARHEMIRTCVLELVPGATPSLLTKLERLKLALESR